MAGLLHKLLALPHTSSQSDIDDPNTTLIHRDIILSKPFLKKIYLFWYDEITKPFKKSDKILEIVMARQVDAVLVVGARNSSNSCRLREVAEQQGVPAWLIEDASEIDPSWLLGTRCIGLTAGASTPEVLVQAVARRLRELGARATRQLPGKAEVVSFRLPAGLIDSREPVI